MPRTPLAAQAAKTPDFHSAQYAHCPYEAPTMRFCTEKKCRKQRHLCSGDPVQFPGLFLFAEVRQSVANLSRSLASPDSELECRTLGK